MSIATAITEAPLLRRKSPPQPRTGVLERFGMVMALGQLDLLVPILADEQCEGEAFQAIMKDR